MWTPDVYEGAPTPVTTFFASAPKVASIALVARVAMDAFGPQAEAWRQIVIFAALASIVVGALGAIGQSNVKRLLAYSSINNVGFLLVGLAAATPQGVASMLLYLTVYVAMTVGSFVAVLMMRDAEGNQLEAISDLSGLARTRFGLAFCLMCLMFSLAGIPPLMGFWAKLVVFQAAVNAGLFVVAVLAVVGSVIGAFYYIKIVKVMFFDEPVDTIRGRSDWTHWALLIISTLAISPVPYLITGWLSALADKAAAALLLVA
jgi:NADH-quinone oxidoreductase subunit N